MNEGGRPEPFSNIWTIPVSWKESEEDVWTVGPKSVDPKFASNSIKNWNKFLVKIPRDGKNYEILLECNLLVGPDLENENIEKDSGVTEMCCAWTSFMMNHVDYYVHKRQLYGGNFGSKIKINSNEILSKRKGFSMEGIMRATGISSPPSVATLSIKRYIPKSNISKIAVYLPYGLITCANKKCLMVLKAYLELMTDNFIRFMVPYHCDMKMNLGIKMFLKIIDDPILFSFFIDFWKETKKEDVAKTFYFLIWKFLPIINHSLYSFSETTNHSEEEGISCNKMKRTQSLLKSSSIDCLTSQELIPLDTSNIVVPVDRIFYEN